MNWDLESLNKFIGILEPQLMNHAVMSKIFNDEEYAEWANRNDNILAWGKRKFYSEHLMACCMMNWAKERIASGYYDAAHDYLMECQIHLNNAHNTERDYAEYYEDCEKIKTKPMRSRYPKINNK